MNREDIIRMAREAQLGTSLIHKGGEQRVWIEGADWHDELERFAALVAAAEREACAKVTEDIDIVEFEHCMVLHQDAAKTLTNAAAAIRARGET